MKTSNEKNGIISEPIWYPIRPTEKGLIGFFSCLFDGKLSLNSIGVYLTPTGDYRLLFPNKRLLNGKEISIYYPINNETYEMILEVVVKKIETIAKGEKNGRRKDLEGNS